MVTGGWITQADRSRWQQRAAAELGAILAAHPDLPVLAWTVAASGGALSGQVLAPAAGSRRELFAQWQRALDESLALLQREAPVIELREAAFCRFRDMKHFEELMILA